MRSAQNKWDFLTSLPEAIHQITIDMSDRGIPYSYRHMHGFSSHAYSFINKEGKRYWVKFHFKTQQGIKNLTDQEAEAIIAKDRESSQKDLFEAIERGDFPRWNMKIQIMTEEQANASKRNPFDLTKTWSQKEYPLIDVGVLELNRNPENYFAEVEQSAFSPSTIVPGIGFSPDRMLQGRLFSYTDTQRYRLGVNYSSIPVNAPKFKPNTYHRDGYMRVESNGSKVEYEPNSQGEWKEQKEYAEPPLKIYGDAYRYDHREDDDDYYTDARALFNLMTDAQKQVLFENTARDMNGVTKEVQLRHIKNCMNVDKAYGLGVAKALGFEEKDIK